MSSWMTPRRVVWLAVVAAVVGRWPGLLWPPYPDEAGYLTVARTWDPGATSMYGHYFVDRTPILVGVFDLADHLGGIGFLRVLGAIACAWLVLAAAGCARVITRDDRAVAWTAVVTAAIVSARVIDPVAAQGELLAIPLIVTSFWLSLLALEQSAALRSAALAVGAGLCGVLAVGLKQNMASALLFGGVLLVAARVAGRISWPAFARLAVAATAGAAVPVLAVVMWARSAGVHLDELWYAVYGFRSDALAVIAGGREPAALDRAGEVVVTVLVTGLAAIAFLFVLRLRPIWRADPVVACGAVALLVFDGASLALGGSFWPPYVFGLVPGTVLFTALLFRAGASAWVRPIAVFAVASTLVGMLSWVWTDQTHWSRGYETGQAIAEVAEPRDTIQVYGGRADVLLGSGLTQPYRYLWGLPMRTLDPDLAELKALLSGPNAPTWLVLEVSMDAWDLGNRTGLQAVIDAHYTPHGTGCDGKPVYVLSGVDRSPLDCSRLPRVHGVEVGRIAGRSGTN